MNPAEVAACEGKDQLTYEQAKRISRRSHGAAPYRCPFCRWWHVGRSMRRDG